MVAGRGSFSEAFPLFGFDFKDYDDLFIEKLDLLLQIRANEFVNWSGKFRPAINNLPIYPRPIQDPLPYGWASEELLNLLLEREFWVYH
jgi:alkanesulfonate monooxygenase SsuD/methylene tetrahydromethanopterin reductase-like flavin-dependent oxidoreductase (luciferase family)